MTTRQISETIEDIYGFDVSEGFISDVTDKLFLRLKTGRTALWMKSIRSSTLMQSIILYVIMV